MSLNGLDDARVKEAHETAVAEPGGWFLLKYATRDEVELLGRGNGGIVEIRNNIAQYKDKSPLYGFLRYRRRNVIIKYLPEDCSRLIQARVVVHFNEVCDRFSPFDTTFSIADAKELKDTKLSAACSLHAASGSTSSSTSSLRRRRLMEIAEEEEEEERERKRQSVVKEEGERPKSPTAQFSDSPVKLNAELAKSPEASRFANELDPPQFTGVARPTSPAKSFDDSARRMSSQSSRTELYPSTSYPYSKPRVKLGPRPSADLAGRPRSSASNTAYRPVSTVPAGIKSFSRGSKKGRSRSQSRDGEAPESPIMEQTESPFPAAETADSVPRALDAEPAQAQAQAQALAPTTATPELKIDTPAATAPPSKPNTMTPEKARLLKAMKLREKKKLMSLQPSPDGPTTETLSAPSTPGLPDEKQVSESAENDIPTADAPQESDLQQDDPLAAPKADSGVDVEADQASEGTRTDSHPASPLATSDIGDSTQASSLSESTDETVLAKEPNSEEEVDGQCNANAPTNQDDSTAPEKVVENPDLGAHNRQSQTTVTPTAVDEAIRNHSLAAPDDQAQQREPAVLDSEVALFVAPASPVPPSSDVAAPSSGQEDATSPEPAEQREPPVSSPSPQPADAGAAGGEHTLPAQIRIPLSKFSTQESKSAATGAASQSIPSIVAPTSDVESWRAKQSAPPVPDKDSAAREVGEAVEVPFGETEQRRRLPERIRTDLDAEVDNRRSVISILDNDGFMDELQSATVQQATPVTVSKSPMSAFFSIDQDSKRATGVSDNNASSAPRFLRTTSNPVRSSMLVLGEPSTAPARSVSSGAAYLQKISQQQASSDLRPKSAKLGSSISQRIKALEKLSGSSAPGDAGVPKERPATTFFAVRKASTREPSRSPSVVDRASSLTREATPSPPASRQSSPETAKPMGRGRSGSLVNRLSMFEGGMPPRGRPESVQVTARIVRDPNQPFPRGPESKSGSTDYAPLELKQSPLVVDVQSRAPSRTPSVASARTTEREIAVQAKQSLLERRLSKQPGDGDKDGGKGEELADGRRPRRRSSLSVVKDFIKDRTESIMGAKSPSTDSLGNPISPASGILNPSQSPSRPPSVHQSGSLARRLSISSRRSSIEQASPVLSSAVLSPGRGRDGAAESITEVRASGDKAAGSSSSGPASPNQSKGSRASRFMRRLSNSLGTGRKSATPSISPTVAEEDAADVEAASRGSTATGGAASSQPSIVAFMGDVNVQFPDNLLWKRRSICLDSQGFLILSAVQGTAMVAPPLSGKDKHAAMVKRYHMSDFKPPYAPDVELQELPNSVVLDLVDGSGLQIACEDRAGQMSILHILEEAHHNHSSFGH